MTSGDWFDLGNLIVACGALAVALVALFRKPPSERVALRALDAMNRAAIDVRGSGSKLHVQNRGNAPATEVSVTAVGSEKGKSSPLDLAQSYMPIDVMQPGSISRFPVSVSIGMPTNWLVEVRWKDADGRVQTKQDTVNFSD